MKQNVNVYRSIFYYFFSFSLFTLLFWFFLYMHNGIYIANKNIICFLTSYLLEIILSLDNVFIWFLVFKSFRVPIFYQKKVLLFGIVAALILRVIFSYFGLFLFCKWHWILYFFGILFIFIGFKTFLITNTVENKKKYLNLSWIYKIFRITNTIYGKKFFFKINNKIFLTPLCISLIFIEISDIIFSMDSIPAIFSITDNLFIIIVSNIFSVLSLRLIYLFIGPIINKFPMIEYALSLILIFIGFKIICEKFIIISTLLTFIIILTILIMTFIINIIFLK